MPIPRRFTTNNPKNSGPIPRSVAEKLSVWEHFCELMKMPGTKRLTFCSKDVL
jgi:hypothetical protein